MAIGAAVVVVVCIFWAIHFGESLAGLSASDVRVPWRAVMGSALLFFLGYVLLGTLWSIVCGELAGIWQTPTRAFAVSAFAWMGRYVPGKVWALAGKAYLTAPRKQDVARVGVAATVETALFLAGGLLGLALLAPLGGLVNEIPVWLTLVALCAVALAVCGLHPRIFVPVANRFLGLIRQAQLSGTPRYRVLVAVLGGYVSVFFLWGLGFACLARGVHPITWADVPRLMAAFSGAWVLALVILIVPAGLGVRESVLVLALAGTSTSQAQIAVMAVGSRIITTVVELACFTIALGVSLLTKSAGEAGPSNAGPPR